MARLWLFSRNQSVKSNTYVRKTGHLVAIGNEAVELGFDTKANGALASIVDKRSGWEFVRDGEAPKALLRLAVRRSDHGVEWFDSRDARRFRWTKKCGPSGALLSLSVSGFPGQELAVEVRVSLAPGSALSVWRMHVTGVRPGEAVHQLTCPLIGGVVKVGDAAPGEAIATPRQGEGYLFRNPYPVADSLPLMAGRGPEQPSMGMGQLWQLYPGNQAMQFILYYNDRAGLYLAAHDAGMNVKSFACGQVADWGTFPVFSISHFPSEVRGADAAFQYDTVVGVFHGDWYDGADIYKAWARRQWWCERKLAQRDIASWMRTGVGVWQMSNYHIPKIKMNHTLDAIASEVNELSRDIGVPLLALIFNFEKGGAWTGPKGFFPPKEGDRAFKAAMKKLRAAGNHGFIYMPGGNWYIAIDSYDPPFDSRAQFEAEGRPNALADERGVVNIQTWYAGWHGARLCPATRFTRDLTAELLLGSLKRGCTVVQIDNFPCASPEACWGTAHGHPPGYGPWYTQAWREILSDVRRRAKALNPDCAITTEGIAETYIPYLDMFDHRAANMEYFGHRSEGDPMGGETIPIFNYVYSGYIGAYTAAYPECNRPEVLYWTRCLGKSLAQGVVPAGGRYWPEPKASNPVTLAFYKKVVRATGQECWRYIMFGEMLRPPEIDVPQIEAAYVQFTGECLDHLLPRNRHVVRDRAIQHSAWRAEDGTVGYFFVNVSEREVRFDVTLLGCSAERRLYDVDIIVDGKRRRMLRGARLPSRRTLKSPPLSVTVIEVKPQAYISPHSR